jgi:anaerobic selenocysteine-containing dehydrogenase
MALGDPDRTVPAFKDLELLVSLDARMNETGALSHYVIATSQHFERHDVTVAGDAIYPEAFAQYAPPVVPKPPATIHDWEFFWGVASRMKVQLTLKYWTYGQVFEAVPGGLPLDMERAPEPEDLVRHLCSYGVVTFEELKANPSGVRPDRPASYVQAAVEDNGARLQLCPPDVAAMNSAYRDARRTEKKYPVNWAYMNPDDLTDEGIEAGALIEIQSEAGRILGLVKADPKVRRGVLSMTHLFGSLEPSTDPPQQRGSHTGRLTSLEDYREPINFMPRFSGIPVNVRQAQ